MITQQVVSFLTVTILTNLLYSDSETPHCHKVYRASVVQFLTCFATSMQERTSVKQHSVHTVFNGYLKVEIVPAACISVVKKELRKLVAMYSRVFDSSVFQLTSFFSSSVNVLFFFPPKKDERKRALSCVISQKIIVFRCTG